MYKKQLIAFIIQHSYLQPTTATNTRNQKSNTPFDQAKTMARSLLGLLLATYVAILSIMLIPVYAGVVLLLAACSDNDKFARADSAAAAPRERVHRSRRRSAAMDPDASTTTTAK
jgi:hypothetical protein